MVHHRPILTEAPQNVTAVRGENCTFRCSFFSDLHHYMVWARRKVVEKDNLEEIYNNSVEVSVGHYLLHCNGMYLRIVFNNRGDG